MMKLLSFGPAFGEPDASPFCIKTMCLLTMAGVQWENQPNSDPRRAPYKKLPVLLDGDQTIADSGNIQRHLEMSYQADFDKSLTTAQRAQSVAWIRLVEEHLYFCQVYDRWVDDASFQHVKAAFFDPMPPVVRFIVPRIVRKQLFSTLNGQGIGRFDYHGMLERANRDLDAIETALTGTRFMFGDTPTAVDASVGAFLAAAQANLNDTGLKQAVLSRPECMRYLSEVRAAIYPKTNVKGLETTGLG